MALYHLGMDVQRNWCPEEGRWYNDPMPLVRTAPQKHLYRTGMVVGAPLVATPGAIKEEAQSLDAEMRAMDDELGAERTKWPIQLTEQQKVMDTWFNTVWLPFWKSWNSFFDDHGNKWGLLNWWHNFWGSAWDQVQDYRRRLAEMRVSAEAAGYRFQAPAPTAPKEHPISAPLGELWGTIKVLIWVGVIFIGATILYRFMVL